MRRKAQTEVLLGSAPSRGDVRIAQKAAGWSKEGAFEGVEEGFEVMGTADQ